MVGAIPQYGWKCKGDWTPTNLRYFRFWIRHWRQRESFFIDSFRPLVLKPYLGVPCGGLGSGSIGRDFRGGFCKYTLRPGFVEYKTSSVPANQFILTIRRQNATVYQQVLTAAPVYGNTLSSWSFNFPPSNVDYVGLYPRSWTTFSVPGRAITLTCRQVSPIIPHDYKDTSLPTTLFVWTVESNEKEDLSISITFTFRNGTGDERWEAENVCHCKSFKNNDCQGIALDHSIDDMRCTYGLAAKCKDKQNVTTRCFDVSGCGKGIWNDLLANGRLTFAEGTDHDWCYVKNRRQLGVALCIQMDVKCGQRSTYEMCLSWDMPKVHFAGRQRTYLRRYTRWFGSDHDAAPKLCVYALNESERWERQIEQWQNATLNNPKIPAWYKSASFNELYYVSDGGTVWFAYDDSWRSDEPHLSEYTLGVMKDFDRFAYLESWEYRLFNTYDVHFYASFALASLWPKIEQCIQAEYSDQIRNEDSTPFTFYYDGDTGCVKSKARVPHDLGCPGTAWFTGSAADPWLYVNSYTMHNTANWRDLNLKFVLMSIRDFTMLREDVAFLKHVWPNVKEIISIGLKEWDTDGDGMIENSGTCDQTYDTWRMYGTSAYCGSLWLASLKAAIKMAETLKDMKTLHSYKETLRRAQNAYDAKLWRGDYYQFDENSRGKLSIMSDQLCGYWFLSACGLEDDLLPKENVQKVVRKIYDNNVCKFKNGTLGAVNGMLPGGVKDRTSMQSEEVWTGVTYSVAALMIKEGMLQEGFQTASGIYKSCFEKFGMQYQTPEALYENNNYRAVGYMRALAIWAIQWNLEKFQILEEKSSTESSNNVTTSTTTANHDTAKS